MLIPDSPTFPVVLPKNPGASPQAFFHRAAAGRSEPPLRAQSQYREVARHARWWAVTDSNRRPSRCKRDALPTELTARPFIAPPPAAWQAACPPKKYAPAEAGA